MLKKTLLFLSLSIFVTLGVAAQKIGKPTLTPVSATPAQQQLIDEGIRLHDAGKYDEAIAKYEQVLKENPDCDLALFELTLTAFNKKDYTKALETAYKLVKYKSNSALGGYTTIGNILDEQGKPQEAIEVYNLAIKQFEGVGEAALMSELYYNLAVTYARQKLLKESREALKKAVVYNFKYPSPSYLLSRVFMAGKYKVPALLAASRLISLELNSQRTIQAVAIIKDILKAPEKNEKGGYNISLDFSAPTDEGEFGAVEIVLGTLMIVSDDADKNKTESERFADGLDTLIAILDEQKKLKSTFSGKTYIPFMAEMKSKGHSRTFAYVILHQGGSAEAKDWLMKNSQKLADFLNWSRSYRLPQ